MNSKILAPMFGAAMLAGLASAGAASAVTMETFTLNQDACSGGCFAPGGNAGTVVVTQNAGALDFLVTLASVTTKSGTVQDLVNANGDSQHHALTFSIANNVSDPITIGKFSVTSLVGKKGATLTPAFTATITNGLIKQSGFDATGKSALDWNDAVNINSSAVQGQTPNSFSFVVTDKNNDLTLSDLLPIGVTGIGQVYLAADVFGNDYKGNTGNVGALAGSTSMATPEPGSWALMLVGVGLVGAPLRARRRQALALASV